MLLNGYAVSEAEGGGLSADTIAAWFQRLLSGNIPLLSSGGDDDESLESRNGQWVTGQNRDMLGSAHRKRIPDHV